MQARGLSGGHAQYLRAFALRGTLDLWLSEFPEFERQWVPCERGAIVLRRNAQQASGTGATPRDWRGTQRSTPAVERQ